MIRASIALVLMLAFAGSTRADADTDAVGKLLADQVEAWNRGNLKGFMAGYWDSPELSFYSGRDKRSGWKETYERYQKRYQADGREMGKLVFSELDTQKFGDGRLMVRGRWALDLKSEMIDGLFTLIVEKKPEGWRIVHDHTSAGDLVKKKP